MTEQLEKIFQKGREDELLYLLRSASKEERKEMAPEIRKLAKHYLEYEKKWDGSYSKRGSDTQANMCMLAAFVCYKPDEYEKQNFGGWILQEEMLNKVIDWYCPDWFSNYVNKLAEQERLYYSFTYEIVMRLADRNILKPGKLLLARLLTNLVFEQNRTREGRGNRLLKPEKLLSRTVTIDEHIWYLFEVETNIHNFSSFGYFEQKNTNKNEGNWIAVFKKLVADGAIDRNRVLREALLASNKNFNKNLSGWFVDLFMELDPTEEELIVLQPYLFSVLNAPNSKPVNTSLQVIKKIAANKSFDIQGFIDQTPVVLASNTKSIIASALMILEKLAKKNAGARPQIGRSAMHVFMHADEELQTKAAKIIHACREELDESFSHELMVYDGSIMSAARSLLQDLFITSASTGEQPEEEVLQEPVEWAPIPGIENIDDFFFLASQSFDNNQSWHFEFLPAMLLKYHSEIINGNISKLEPALQRALKINKSGFVSTQGNLDHMLSQFLIDVCVDLVKKYPAQAGSLRELFGKFDRKEEPNRFVWLDRGESESYVVAWTTHYKDKIYEPHKYLLRLALAFLRTGSKLPLLSTPTHEPGWLDPLTLVQRLAFYEQENTIPANLDFQVAVSRCLLENTGKAIAAAENLLTGENLNLVLFLFGKHPEPQGPFTQNAVWMAASLALKEKKKYAAFESFSYYTKPLEYYTGQLVWESVNEEFRNERWEYSNGAPKRIPFTDHRKIIRFILPKIEKQEEPKKSQGGFFSKLFSRTEKMEKAPVQEDKLLLYDYLVTSSPYFSFNHNDMRRFFSLTPNNPEPLLVEVIKTCLKDPVLSSESDKKMVAAVLQVMHELWNNAGGMAHVFLGTCMLASDKTVANIAGEIWLKGVGNGTVDTAAIGRVIGVHEKIEFAPLKRFTDLVSQQLFRVSAFHNKQLQCLVENIFAELPDEPVKGLKKLVEIYTELLAVNKTTPSELIAAKLKGWKKTK